MRRVSSILRRTLASSSSSMRMRLWSLWTSSSLSRRSRLIWCRLGLKASECSESWVENLKPFLSLVEAIVLPPTVYIIRIEENRCCVFPPW